MTDPQSPPDGLTQGKRGVATDGAQPDGRDPVEVGVLARLVGDDAATLGDFFADFARSASEAGRSLEEALASGDRGAAGSCAHRLKGSARSVGAHGLGELCARIEAHCGDADVAALTQALPAFQAELQRVRRWIEARHGGPREALQQEDGR